MIGVRHVSERFYFGDGFLLLAAPSADLRGKNRQVRGAKGIAVFIAGLKSNRPACLIESLIFASNCSVCFREQHQSIGLVRPLPEAFRQKRTRFAESIARNRLVSPRPRNQTLKPFARVKSFFKLLSRVGRKRALRFVKLSII